MHTIRLDSNKAESHAGVELTARLFVGAALPAAQAPACQDSDRRFRRTTRLYCLETEHQAVHQHF
jgi:hypothetical protein